MIYRVEYTGTILGVSGLHCISLRSKGKRGAMMSYL